MATYSMKLPKLQTMDHWTAWYATIAQYAKAHKVWNDVDPKLDGIGRWPEEPARPTNETATSNDWNAWNADLKQHHARTTVLLNISSMISESVDDTFKSFVIDATHPKEMLRPLYKLLSPTDRRINDEIRTEFDRLQRGPKIGNQDLEAWMLDWNRLLQRTTMLDRPVAGIDEAAICNAFQQACQQWSTVYTLIEMKRLQREQAAKALLLIDCMEIFSREVKVIKRHANAALSLNGSQQPQQPQQPRQQREPTKPCLCGGKHRYAQCWILNEKIRPSTFKCEGSRWQRVQDALAKDQALEARIRTIIDRYNTQQPTTGDSTAVSTPASALASSASRQTNFAAMALSRSTTSTKAPAPVETITHRVSNSQAVMGSDYSLRDEGILNDWMLDNGTDTHVCNSKESFVTYRDVLPTEEYYLQVGNTTCAVQGIGEVDITVTGPNGPFNITLLKTLYVPGFHTNLVSGGLLRAKGVRLNEVTEWLVNTIDGSNFIKPILRNEFWWLSIAKPSPMAMAITSSRQNRVEKATKQQWHERLGHPGQEALDQIIKQSQELMKIDSAPQETPKQQQADICEACALSVAPQQISRREMPRGARPFERVHLDVIFEQKAYNGDKFVLHLLCDYSNYHVAFSYPDNRQNTLMQGIEMIYAFAEAHGYKIRYFHMDNDPSLKSMFDDFMRKKGITHEPSAPYTKGQNGRIERSGDIMMTTARKLRIHGKLPNSLWPELYQMAVYLLNRRPNRRLQWSTPFEMVFKRKPSPQTTLRTIGARAYVRRHPETAYNRDGRPDDIKGPKKISKLDERAWIGYLVGYDASNILRIWNPITGRVIRSRDVIIDENRFYDPSLHIVTTQQVKIANVMLNSIDLDLDEQFSTTASGSVDIRDLDLEFQVPASTTECPPAHGLLTPDPTPTPRRTTTPQDTPLSPTGTEVGGNTERLSPTPSDETSDTLSEIVVASRPQSPVLAPTTTTVTRAQSEHQVLANLRSSRRNIKLTEKARQATEATDSADTDNSTPVLNRRQRRNLANLTLSPDPLQRIWLSFATQSKPRIHRNQLPPPPRYWREVLKHPFKQQLIAAANQEMDKLWERGTFVSTPQSELNIDAQVLPVRWVFDYKFDSDGYLIRYKARLCVRGDYQTIALREDVYAATGTMTTFRILAALIAGLDLDASQYDCVNAFLYALIDRLTYVEYPEGFKVPGHVLRLLKALYGLKQSPKLWYDEIGTALIALGFQPCLDETCLWIHTIYPLIIFVYVDDLLAVSPPNYTPQMKMLMKELMESFEIRDLGPIDHFLNVHVIRDRPTKRLWISQHGYIDKLAHRFHQDPPTRSALTPLPTTYDDNRYNGEVSPAAIQGYQEYVGSEIYPSIVTRPDITKAANTLAKHAQCPSPLHRQAAQHLITFLQSTKHWAIEYSANGFDFSSPLDLSDILETMADASYADDIETRHSSQGYVIKLFNGAIAWQAGRQTTVTTSTTEAELLSVSNVAKELMRLSRILKAIISPTLLPLAIACDNSQTIGVINKATPNLTTRLKHIDIHQLWIRQEAQHGKIRVYWVPTTDMIADGMTKLLPVEKHRRFMTQLGMVDISDRLSKEYSI